MKDQFTPIMRHTRHWRFENGTTELFLGGFILWAGLAFMAQSPAITLILFIIGAGGIARVIKAVQQKYVYPRSGFVEYAENTGKGIWKLILAIIGGLLVMAVFAGLVLVFDSRHILAWVSSLTAFFDGLVLAYSSLKFKLWRLGLISLISIVLGFLISPFVLRGSLLEGYAGIGTMWFYFIAFGLSLLISGGFAFRSFLIQNPIPMEGPHGE